MKALNANKLTAWELEIQKTTAACDMYQLLSMFLRLPTDEMAAGITDGSLLEDISEIFRELGINGGEAEMIKTKLNSFKTGKLGQKELFTELRREYTRLFCHPEKSAVDIYETLFLFQFQPKGNCKIPSLFISPTALDVLRRYRQAGLMKTEEFNESADHMATEMEFMAHLYLQKSQLLLLRNNNKKELAKNDEQIWEFMELHLNKWAAAFYERCISVCENEIYLAFFQAGKLVIEKNCDADHLLL